MRLLPQPDGTLRLRLDSDEASLLGALTGQLIDLLRTHSETELDPDPFFASLEIGGSEEPPSDPALARLFPDAYEGTDESSDFRRVTEQGLLNRKLQDALTVVSALGIEDSGDFSLATDVTFDPEGVESHTTTEVTITEETMPPWVRTITSLRLAIAARIGLESAEDQERLADDDEAHSTLYVYDWLAAILDSVLRMMPQPGT